jgi:cytochrome P450
MCAGLYLARMEMEVMLEAMVENGVTPRTGGPAVGANKGLFGFTALPYELMN